MWCERRPGARGCPACVCVCVCLCVPSIRSLRACHLGCVTLERTPRTNGWAMRACDFRPYAMRSLRTKAGCISGKKSARTRDSVEWAEIDRLLYVAHYLNIGYGDKKMMRVDVDRCACERQKQREIKKKRTGLVGVNQGSEESGSNPAKGRMEKGSRVDERLYSCAQSRRKRKVSTMGRWHRMWYGERPQ